AVNGNTYLRCWGLSIGTLLTPIIWAEPGPEVAQGKPVSIWCQGSQHADQYFLYREGVSEPLRREFPMGPSNKAKFPFSHMTYNLAGRYFCLYHRRTRRSVPSKPLDLAVTGMFNKPSLVALPSPIVTSGGSVTLQCGSWQAFDWFVLCSEGGEGHPRHLDAQHQADGWFQALFPVDPMSPSHRPTYRCYGYFSSSPYVWSTSSLILELLISAPTLSAWPSPTVAPGENVTLRCQSPSLFDAFLLSKEGEAGPPLHLRSQHQDGVFQANFPLRPATLDHGGTYRCYGSLGSTPFLLSHPSDPLELVVTGEGLSECLPPHPFSPLPDHTLENLIRMGLSTLVLVALAIYLLCCNVISSFPGEAAG
uniref:Immunoglobulin domain-containing protein n=1 Tax=Ursus americanus TaxID=9643 RepID=A0A452R0Z2_URSAM